MRSLHTLARSLLAALMLGIPAVMQAQGFAARPAPVEIVLLPEVRADGPLIRLGHVAQLSGGDANLRAALANLDVSDFGAGAGAVTLGRAELKFRLLIAGHDARSFRLAGAVRSRVTRCTDALTEARVVEAGRQLLQQQVAAVAQPLAIRSAGPVLIPALKVGPRSQVRLHAEMTPTRVTVGATPVDVSVLIDGQARAVIRTWFDVQPTEQPVARIVFDPSADGQAPSVNGPVVVRGRDRVRMVAHIGGSQIIAAGEAMEDGRVGQSIRLRNIDSNKTVIGRVVGPNLVEVEY